MAPRISRRAVLAGSAALAGFGAGPARAAEFSYKLGTNVPADHPLSARAQEAADAILAGTGGRFELKVFPSSQLGGDSDMLSQLRDGALEFFAVSGVSGLSTLIPGSSIYGLGFAFPDYPAVWRAMDGDLGRLLRAQIAGAGLVAMDRIWDSGFRQITTAGKPVATPADLDRMKLRVPAGALYRSIFLALGTLPTAINLSEVYSALQTRVVDGEENGLVTISTAKFYEVQKFCAMTNHMWDGYWFLANRGAWDAVPADVRQVVAREIDAAALRQRADMEKLGGELRGQLQAAGMTFTEPDRALFRAALAKAGFYRDWKAKYGAAEWAALEAVVGSFG